ncbi:MAG: hypothetical protein IPM27_08350 [Nitrosomonadales bacterium]|nr:hypothetical protein [Nitrosomonadales bacterium]
MNRLLTQPEEIDHILEVMASHDAEADIPAMPSCGGMPIDKHDKPIGATGSSCDEESSRGSPKPLPYAWSL